MTPLYVSIPVLIWLSVCAWFDWKSRRVSNWLTLPVLGTAVIVRFLGYGLGDLQIILLLALLVLLGWIAHLVGGADAKASLSMILIDPCLAVWAWAGVVVFYLVILCIKRARRISEFPGFLGFTIGVFAYMCFNII